MTDMIYVVAFPLVSYCKGREMFNKAKLEAGISTALHLVNKVTVGIKCKMR